MPGMMTSLHSKYMTSGYQSRQADNQLAEKSLSHMQTLGFWGKLCPGYVLSTSITWAD